jgi:hypothetical protein
MDAELVEGVILMRVESAGEAIGEKARVELNA